MPDAETSAVADAVPAQRPSVRVQHLLKVARVEFVAGGFDAVSIDAIARASGVSKETIYRYFPDKQALMRALASEGIEQLGQFQQAAADGAANSADAFAATGRAYVRFALAHPALFRLMFSQCEPIGVSIFGENLAARMLQDKAAVATGGNPEETRRLMIQAWSVVHGLAMLMLDQQLPADDALIDRVIDQATLFPR